MAPVEYAAIYYASTFMQNNETSTPCCGCGLSLRRRAIENLDTLKEDLALAAVDTTAADKAEGFTAANGAGVQRHGATVLHHEAAVL